MSTLAKYARGTNLLTRSRDDKSNETTGVRDRSGRKHSTPTVGDTGNGSTERQHATSTRAPTCAETGWKRRCPVSRLSRAALHRATERPRSSSSHAPSTREASRGRSTLGAHWQERSRESQHRGRSSPTWAAASLVPQEPRLPRGTFPADQSHVMSSGGDNPNLGRPVPGAQTLAVPRQERQAATDLTEAFEDAYPTTSATSGEAQSAGTH